MLPSRLLQGRLTLLCSSNGTQGWWGQFVVPGDLLLLCTTASELWGVLPVWFCHRQTDKLWTSTCQASSPGVFHSKAPQLICCAACERNSFTWEQARIKGERKAGEQREPWAWIHVHQRQKSLLGLWKCLHWGRLAVFIVGCGAYVQVWHLKPHATVRRGEANVIRAVQLSLDVAAGQPRKCATKIQFLPTVFCFPFVQTPLFRKAV